MLLYICLDANQKQVPSNRMENKQTRRENRDSLGSGVKGLFVLLATVTVLGRDSSAWKSWRRGKQE
jgi:hypothetical protein